MCIEDIIQPVYLFPFTAEAALMHYILKNHDIKTAGFLDNKEDLCSESYDGISFLLPQATANKDAAGTVIVCGYRYYEHMNHFNELGFHDVIKIERLLDKEDVDSALPEIDVVNFEKLAPRQKFRLSRMWHDILAMILPKNIRNNSDSIILNSATFYITTKCTLKCRKCVNLIQYYEKQRHVELGSIIEDMKLLFNKVDFARELVLLGGEPLIHPDLREIVKHANRYRDKYGMFRIVTNGTAMPIEETFNVFRESGVFIKISDYGTLSRNKDELINKLDLHGNPYQLEEIIWTEMMQLMDDPRNESGEVFTKCHAKNICSIIKNGKFYRCAFLASAEELKAVPYNKGNSFDLRNNELTKKDFMNYIHQTNALAGCDYCTGGDNDHPLTSVAEQTKESLPYKKFGDYPPGYN